MRKSYTVPFILLGIGTLLYVIGLGQWNRPGIELGGLLLGIGADILVYRILQNQQRTKVPQWLWFIMGGTPILLAGLPFWFMDVIGAGLIACGILLYILTIRPQKIEEARSSSNSEPPEQRGRAARRKSMVIIGGSLAAIVGIVAVGSVFSVAFEQGKRETLEAELAVRTPAPTAASTDVTVAPTATRSATSAPTAIVTPTPSSALASTPTASPVSASTPTVSPITTPVSAGPSTTQTQNAPTADEMRNLIQRALQSPEIVTWDRLQWLQATDEQRREAACWAFIEAEQYLVPGGEIQDVITDDASAATFDDELDQVVNAISAWYRSAPNGAILQDFLVFVDADGNTLELHFN